MPEIRKIKHPMVGRPILRHKPPSIDAERHRQILRGHVMNHLVVGPLQEGRIDRNHRPHALCGHSCGKRHGMLLRDPNVIESFGKDLLKGV